MRLRERAAGVAGLLAISACMSGVMSAVMTLINAGPVPNFPGLWAKSWGLGIAVSMPTAAVVIPPIVRWQNARRRHP